MPEFFIKFDESNEPYLSPKPKSRFHGRRVEKCENVEKIKINEIRLVANIETSGFILFSRCFRIADKFNAKSGRETRANIAICLMPKNAKHPNVKEIILREKRNSFRDFINMKIEDRIRKARTILYQRKLGLVKERCSRKGIDWFSTII